MSVDRHTPTPTSHPGDIDGGSYGEAVDEEIAALWVRALVTLGSVAGTNTVTAAAAVPITAYVAGMAFLVTWANNNSGAATINIDGCGAKDLKDSAGNAVSSGALAAGRTDIVTYNGTHFRVLSIPGSISVENQGADGDDGFNFLSGTGVPSDVLGNNGDTYINVSTGQFYKKAAGTWGTLGDPFAGPAGEDGEDGEDGADGAAATIAVGDVDTVEPDDPATVTNSGTPSAAVFDFGLPKGQKGDQGPAYESYLVLVRRESGVSIGEYPADRSASVASVLDRVYAEVIDGGVGDEFEFEMFVNGATVYGPETVVNGTPHDVTGENIAIAEGDKVSFAVISADATVKEVFFKASGLAEINGSAIHAASAKTTPVDLDEVPIADSAASWALKRVTWANVKATLKTYFDTLYMGISALASTIVAATGKTTPVDADLLAITDSAASNALKKLTWANLKATLKTYFDTLYTEASDFASVAFTGAFADLVSKPTTLGGYGITDAYGKQTFWVPASAMVPQTTAGAVPETLESSGNQVMRQTLNFAHDANKFAQFAIAMPKSWNESTFTFQFIWESPDGTGNVVWSIQALARSDDDAIDAAWGTAQQVTDGVTATSDVMISGETSAMTAAGSPAELDLVIFRIYRDTGSGSDTSNVLAKLVGVRGFYTTNAANDA